MIASATHIGLTGLQAASRRLENSASNVANIHSTSSLVNGQRVDQPFTPRRIDQVSLESGGVRTVSREVEPATVAVADAEGGVTEFPNVNLEQEVIDQQFARYDFKANLKSIEAEDENIQALLDILA